MDSVDWQLIANIAASLAVILALAVFVWQIRNTRHEREFAVFFRYVDAYEQLKSRRLDNWRRLKESVRSDSRIQDEIGDRTNSIQYLLLRTKQPEPMYAIEHAVLEYEIQCVNLLNEMCRYALRDTGKLCLLKALFANEISFYQNSLPGIVNLRERERPERLFSVAKYESLEKCEIGDVFDIPGAGAQDAAPPHSGRAGEPHSVRED